MIWAFFWGLVIGELSRRFPLRRSAAPAPSPPTPRLTDWQACPSCGVLVRGAHSCAANDAPASIEETEASPGIAPPRPAACVPRRLMPEPTMPELVPPEPAPLPPIGEPTRHWRQSKSTENRQIRRIGYSPERITCLLDKVGHAHWELHLLDGSLRRIAEPQRFGSEKAAKDHVERLARTLQGRAVLSAHPRSTSTPTPGQPPGGAA